MSEKKKELTESQKVFCREWVYDFNGSRAYRVAYPHVKEITARTEASKLLANPNVRAYARSLQENLEELAGISRLMVLQEFQKLAFSSIAHLHETWITRKEFDKLTDHQKACIQEIQTQTRTESKYDAEEEGFVPVEVDFVKIKLYDKQRALESINKMLGYEAPKKIEHSGEALKGFQIIAASDKRNSGK